ncbi:outer membrane protein assembly factor, partial [Acinetobacter sp.]
MPAKINFKKTMLHLSMSHIVHRHHSNKRLWMSIFLTLLAQQGMAAENPAKPADAALAELAEELQRDDAAQPQQLAMPKAAEKMPALPALEQGPDSMQMLQQQENSAAPIEAFKPIEFEELDDLPLAPIDQNMANEILQVAEEAKREAQNYRASQNTENAVADMTQQELAQINQAPVNVDQLMQSIRADSEISVSSNPAAGPQDDPFAAVLPLSDKEPGLLTRLWYKVRPPRELNTAKVPRISADVVIRASENTSEASSKAYAASLENLKANIKGKLSSFTVESFSDFPSALPQLRALSNQAAQAVGFYNPEFKFEKLSSSRVRVSVVPNMPVLIKAHDVEFSGSGANDAQFQVISVLPDQDVGDILHHGAYETTKARITDAASNNGYFDAYWRLHDVKVAQPQNTADINLRYETGGRYKLGNVEFRMSNPSAAFPLDPDILASLVTWEDGADYTSWRVNGLANNLTNSRYFNYTLVDAVRPDPIELPLELPPDLQALVDQHQLEESAAAVQDKKAVASNKEVSQSLVNEAQFAGVNEREKNGALRAMQSQQEQKEQEQERLQAQARAEKKVPVIVTLNADKLNSAEIGAGFGTDTGPRLRGQYRRAIVNSRGHSFDANMEVSTIRQSIDGRYNMPYKHPLNDYI